MALIDIHVPDEHVINLLRREKALRVGDGTVTDIQIIGERVSVVVEYEIPEPVLRGLID